MVTAHTEIKAKGHLVQKTEWKHSDGRTRPIALPCPLTAFCRSVNKAVIDRRLRPGVATWEVTLNARKVVLCVRWPARLQLILLRRVNSQAQGCVCTALQLGGDVEQPWLMTSSIKKEVYNVSLRRQRRTEPRPQAACTKLVKIGRVGPKIWSRTDITHIQTNAHRHAPNNTPPPYWGRNNETLL